jgi:hypothetical protein
MILCLAGICLGTLAKVSDETFGALGYTYTVIAVCKYAYAWSLSVTAAYIYIYIYSGMNSCDSGCSPAVQNRSLEIIRA